MNVFHKVLVKIYEITGGKDNVDVDLTDLLKKEGFYSNIESISGQLQDEGWVSETSRKHVVRITHWGTTEAKRVLSGKPAASGDEVGKDAKVFVNEAKQLVSLMEEFASKPDAKNLDAVDKGLSRLADHAKAIRSRI